MAARLYYLFTNIMAMFRRKKTEKPEALPEEKQQEDLQPHDAQPEGDQNLPADESEETEEAEKREPEADEAEADKAEAEADKAEAETEKAEADKAEHEADKVDAETETEAVGPLGLDRDSEAAGFGSGLTEEDFAKAEELGELICRDRMAGSYSVQSRNALLKAVSYERMLEEADAAGELRGRNASIDELTDLMLDSDGVPHASGCGAGAKPKVSTIFDLAREA